MIRVVLVDDHQLVREAMREAFEKGGDIQVVGEAGSGEEAVDLVPRLRPDVTLMDVSMPGMGGLEATRKLLRRDPGLKVVVLSMHDSGPYPRRLLDAGATGYVAKSSGIGACREAIHRAAAGLPYVSQTVGQHLSLARRGRREDDRLGGLSAREYEIMLRTVKGYSIRAIARALHYSTSTVRTYRSRLFRKLGIRSDIELVHLALSHGVIQPGTGVAGTQPEPTPPHPDRGWPSPCAGDGEADDEDG
jgi:two-component system invasion response regulator UvrY